MGACTFQFDPPGYFFASEPGFSGSFTGAVLLDKSLDAAEASIVGAAPPAINLSWFNPAGADWIVPKPLQFEPKYFAREYASGHELATFRAAEYTAPELTIKESDLTKKPGDAGGANKDWWQTAVTPENPVSLDTCSYSGMEDQMPFDLPESMATVAILSNTPAALNAPQPLGDADYCPFIRWQSSPPPDDWVVWGFSNIALVCTGDAIFVLQSPNNDKVTWTLIGQGHFGEGPHPERPRQGKNSTHVSMMAATTFYARERNLLVLPVGADSLYIYTGFGEPLRVKIRKPETSLDAERMFPAGTWWIGLAGNQKLTWQIECVAFPSSPASLHPLTTLFDLGPRYKPTEPLESKLHYRFGWYQGIGTSETTDGSGRTVVTATDGQTITYGVTKPNDDIWDSDGTVYQGIMKLDASGGAPPTGDAVRFLAPQIRGFEIRLPVHLEARANNSLTLSDTQVHSWEAEAALPDVDGKKVEIILRPEAADLLVGGENLDFRTDYPLHIIEGGVVRVRCWVESPDLEEILLENGTSRTVPLRAYKVAAKALFSRADSGWLYMPEILNPLNANPGRLEHTDLVKTVVHSVGFDVTDATVYSAAVDDQAGSAIAELPGTWAATSGTTGEDNSGAHNPDYSQAKSEYLRHLTVEFRGWRLYERLDGRLMYHADPVFWWGLGGRQYYLAATIYRTSAAAALAGVPRQYMLDKPQRTILQPVANVLQISGQGDDAKLFPHVIESEPATWTDENDPDFIGEPKPIAYASKLAVEEVKMAALARTALMFTKHRGRVWSVSIPLAPWQIGSGIQLGDVVSLEGPTRSDCWVRHIQVFQQKRDQYITRLTVQRLAAGNNAVAVAACTGGTPFPGACLIS